MSRLFPGMLLWGCADPQPSPVFDPAQALQRALDADADGCVQAAELVGATPGLIRHADEDQDRCLSAVELRAALDAVQDRLHEDNRAGKPSPAPGHDGGTASSGPERR